MRDVVVTEPAGLDVAVMAHLREIGEVRTADGTREHLLMHLGTADVLWVRLRHRLDGEVFDAAPHLRWLASPTTGLTHIDLDAAMARGIEVVSLRGETEFLRDVRATAEHTVAVLLALLRHIPSAAAHAAQGGWNRDFFKGHELYGRTAGIVGYGRLGRIVGRYLQAFGMRVLAADPHVPPSEAEPGVVIDVLSNVLAASDVVSLHVDHRPETHGFFGDAEFARMRSGAWFVNTARGEVLDEEALLTALRSGHLAGAALDVIAGERADGMVGHPLVRFAEAYPERLLLTPHLGGNTVESLMKAETFLAAKLRRLIAATDA